MECKIIFERDPETLKITDKIKFVKASNGKRSNLFDDIRRVVIDDVESLNTYYKIYTDEFKSQFGNWEVGDTNYNVIKRTDKIVWGHPTIGKSVLKNQGDDRFISLDDDYGQIIKDNVNIIAKKYNVSAYQVKDGGSNIWNVEYNTFMQDLFDMAKAEALSKNKTLFVSNTNLLKNNLDSFDKIINLTDSEFEKRILNRGAKYDIKEWKSSINEVIAQAPKEKVINTTKYLSELLSSNLDENGEPLFDSIESIILPSKDVKSDELFNVEDDFYKPRVESDLIIKTIVTDNEYDNNQAKEIILPNGLRYKQVNEFTELWGYGLKIDSSLKYIFKEIDNLRHSDPDLLYIPYDYYIEYPESKQLEYDKTIAWDNYNKAFGNPESGRLLEIAMSVEDYILKFQQEIVRPNIINKIKNDLKLLLNKYTNSETVNNVLQYVIKDNYNFQDPDNIELAKQLIKGIIENPELYNVNDLTNIKPLPIQSTFRDTYFDNSSQTNHIDLLDKMSKSNSLFAPLANKLSSLPFMIEPIRIDLVQKESFKDEYKKNVAGVFNPNSNSIRIAELYPYTKIEGLESTTLHEVLHGLTHSYIKQGGPLVDELQRIYEEALKYKDDFERKYALKNLDEFLVAVFTDQDFMRDMQKIPPIDKDGISLWNEVLEWLKNVFDLIKGERTLFDDAFYISAKIVEDASTGYDSGDGILFNVNDSFKEEVQLAFVDYTNRPNIPKHDSYLYKPMYVRDITPYVNVIKGYEKEYRGFTREKFFELPKYIRTFYEKLELPQNSLQLSLRTYIDEGGTKSKNKEELYQEYQDFKNSLLPDFDKMFEEDYNKATNKVNELTQNLTDKLKTIGFDSDEISNIFDLLNTNNEENIELASMIINGRVGDVLFNIDDSIKPGVDELFEQNPELATSVYDALGFGNFDKTYNYATDIVNQFDADVETIINGMRNISIADNQDYDIELELKLAKDNGIKHLMWVDPYNDVEHYIFYNKDGEQQAKEIYNLKTIYGTPEYRAQLGYLLQYDLDTVSSFTNIPRNKIKRLVTPQQKQQAKQEYSKYLNQGGSKQDIQRFKEFVNKPTFDKELAQKIQEKLQKLYPEIKLNITNNPVWEQGDNVFNQNIDDKINNFELFEDRDKLCPTGICNYTAKMSTEHLQKIGLNPYPSNYNGSQLPVKVKSPIGDFNIEHYVSAVAINNAIYIYDMPQDEFISNEFFGKGSDVKVKESYKPRLISLTIDEIKSNYNISTQEAGHFIHSIINNNGWEGADAAPSFREYIENNIKNSQEYINLLESQIKDSGYEFKQWDVEEYRQEYNNKRQQKKLKKISKKEEQKVINYYENKLKLKTKEYLPKKTDSFSLKTLINSVLGRGFEKIIDNNSFEAALQSLDTYLKSEKFVEDLLDKVTNAEESLITINKSIDTVYMLAGLFSSFTKNVKVYGIEEAIKKYDSKQQYTIRTLLPSNVLDKYKSKEQAALLLQKYWGNKDNIVKQLNIYKTKTFTDLVTNRFKAYSVFNKYQTVLNFLKSTDFDSSYLYQAISNEAIRRYSYFDKIGNTQFQKDEFSRIIGQANIKAMTVLVDAINQKQDTLPHEYAHHYIAWYKNTPIVQEAIKKWGSEEALVQSIGEQVVKQKGEAYNWWNKFVKWIMSQFNSLSKLQKEELTQILTDAFLTRQDLGFKGIEGFKDWVGNDQQIINSPKFQAFNKANPNTTLEENLAYYKQCKL